MRLVSLLLALLPVCAVAQETDRWRVRQIQIENDVFWGTWSVPGPDDRFYTSGLRVSASKGRFSSAADDQELPGWLRPVRKRCMQCVIYPNLAVSQSIYTPEDLENPDPQPGDRPWAAWLFAGMGAAVETSARSRHEFEVQFGITGEEAGGKLVQRLWHELASSPEPKGWDHQFGPDAGLNVYYAFQHILLESPDGSRITWDFVPNARFATGTMMTYASIGGTIRFGRNITGFPYSLIHTHDTRPSVARDRNFEIYGFVGADMRTVAYNYFLEGSLFEEDPYTVRAKRSVWDFTFGMTARFRHYYLTYAIVRRSPEFLRTIGTDPGVHSYGSLTLTVGLR
jgi:hypothetical protein